MTTALGIDVGTQSVKVVFYDAEARKNLATASAPLALYQTDNGVAEQQASWWVDALRTALLQVEPSIRASVTAIGVSGQQHGFVPINLAGQPLLPAKLWCDTSTTPECDYLIEQFGGENACIAELGNSILPGYTASKLLWFRNSHPDLYAQMHAILLPHDYINFYLTGEKTMEAGDASGTGFLNIFERQWSEKMLKAIDPTKDLRDCLPRVETSISQIGTLRPYIASEIGLPAGTPVSSGGGDNMMSAIGTGNVATGVVTMSLGTSGTIFTYSDTPIVDPQGHAAAFCSSTGGWLPLICTMNCTTGTELMRDLFKTDLDTFEASLQSSARGAEGILTVPFFNGERTPNLPNASGCILGLNGQNMRQENFLRSAVEGVTFGLRMGLEVLTQQTNETKEIVLTGGGANSPIWRQTVADICNAPVKVLKNKEAAAFGAALNAIACVSDEDIENLTKAHLEPDVEECCEPQQAAVAFYHDRYQAYHRATTYVADIYS